LRRLKGLAVIALLVAGDLAGVLLSYILGYFVRSWWSGGETFTSSLLNRAYLLLVFPFVFAYEGLYTRRLTEWEERRRCVRGVVIGSALLTILLFMVRLWIVSRLVVVLSALFSAVLVPSIRTLLKRLLVRLQLLDQPLVIFGYGSAARLFEAELNKHRTMGYRVVARIERPADSEPLSALVSRAEIPPGSLVVVLADCFREPELKEIFEYAEQSFAEMMILPNLSLLTTSTAAVEQIGSLLVLKYRYNLLRPMNLWTKQVLEFVLSLVLTIVLLPVFAVLALLVKLSSPGPVFFRQPRIGRGGKVFTCLKFRTMYQDAEARLEEILKRDPAVRAEWERYARITGDPRVTRIGRWLRRFSLDELPQLLNVLRGEMALVGPRPYLVSELERVGKYLKTIVRVRPGLTGLWQVSGRAELPFEERMLLDEYYIRNWSLWLDFSILVRTIRAVLTGRGAY